MRPLNSPLEAGIRVLMILAEAFPNRMDLGQLVMLDYCLLHSSDVGGPDSLHPPLPVRAGELGVKRQVLEHGLEVMARAGLVQIASSDQGIEYLATDGAASFLSILESNYAQSLHERAQWVVEEYGELDGPALRETMNAIVGHWSEEFDFLAPVMDGGAE